MDLTDRTPGRAIELELRLAKTSLLIVIVIVAVTTFSVLFSPLDRVLLLLSFDVAFIDLSGINKTMRSPHCGKFKRLSMRAPFGRKCAQTRALMNKTNNRSHEQRSADEAMSSRA